MSEPKGIEMDAVGCQFEPYLSAGYVCTAPARGLSQKNLNIRRPQPQCCRAEVRRSFNTTTVRDESQVTPQGRHR